MKSLSYFFALCVFGVLAEKSDNDASSDPTVYVDISKSAREDAVSFGGARGLFGADLAFQDFDASVGNASNSTKNNVNLLGVCLGMEYAKAFRKGFLVAVDVGMDVSKKAKKDGSWSALNSEYETQRGVAHPGSRTGKLDSDTVSLNVAVKGGYLLPTYNSMMFLKLGVSKVGGTYSYKQGNNKVCDVKVSAYVPSLGLGIERKINKKWGASLEANLSLKKTSKKNCDNVEHKVKIGRTDIKLMAIYSVPLSEQ
ncbi:MAG: hypothetical protein LBF54_04425 [Holosporaceae bacterium]|jgi:hypothetical protein|nr:hypothetical protein [Holosporaceae bacterium]